MIKYIIILIFLVTIIGCSSETKKINRHPFEIDKSISGIDLLDNGYRWMPGVDVILIGKKTKDTLDYYQLDFPVEEIDEVEVLGIEDYEEVKIQNYDTTSVELEETITPLDMPDSIYKREWISDEGQYKEMFSKGIPTTRYYYITMTKSNLESFKRTIDPLKYKLKRKNEISDYYIDEFSIVNLQSKDTFRCSVKALEDGRLEFMSQISLEN